MVPWLEPVLALIPERHKQMRKGYTNKRALNICCISFRNIEQRLIYADTQPNGQLTKQQLPTTKQRKQPTDTTDQDPYTLQTRVTHIRTRNHVHDAVRNSMSFSCFNNIQDFQYCFSLPNFVPLHLGSCS